MELLPQLSKVNLLQDLKEIESKMFDLELSLLCSSTNKSLTKNRNLFCLESMNEKVFSKIIFTQSSSSSKFHKELRGFQTYNCLLEKKHFRVKNFVQQRKKAAFI